MKRAALICLSLLLAIALTLDASAFRGGGGGVYRGGGGAGAIRGPGGGGAIRGPMGGGIARGPAGGTAVRGPLGGGAAVGAGGGAAIRGPMGGGAAVGPGGGAAVRGPVGGGVATGPRGNVAVRGPAGNVAVGSRGSDTNVYGGTYPYYGWGAVAAGAAVGAAAGAVAAAPYYYPILSSALLPTSMRTALFATVPGRLSLPLLGLPKATPLRISTFEIIQRKVGLGSWAVNLELVHKERPDPVCGIGCAALRQSRRDDWKAFAVERADRREQSEDETHCGE